VCWHAVCTRRAVSGFCPTHHEPTDGDRPYYRGSVADIVLPHAVLAALWIPRLAGEEMPRAGELPRAVAALTGDGEEHVVELSTDAGSLATAMPPPLTLAQLLGRFAAQPLSDVGALLPRPGHVVGLPKVVLHDALTAEQCLLLAGPAGSWAVIPHAETFGSVQERGTLVRWSVHAIPPHELPVSVLLGSVGSLSDVRREVATATAHATEVLRSLLAGSASLRTHHVELGELPAEILPSALDSRRFTLLYRCARLLGLLQAAMEVEDDVAHPQWAEELRQLETVARRGLSAASLYRGRS